MSLSSLNLDAFVAVSQTRHFSEAAKKLNVTQSALSQRVLNLEADLGTTLFIRDRSGVKLTEFAERLLRYCKTKEALEDELLQSLTSSRDSVAGVIRIGGFSSVMRSVILPALAPLLRDNPRLQVTTYTPEVRELPQMLKQGEIDYMVLNQQLDKDELASHLLGHEENVLIQSRQHSSPEIFLDHDEEDETTANYMRLAKRKVTKLERRYFDEVYGLIDGVKMGLGKAVVPRHLVIEDKDLKILSPEIVLKIPVVLHYYQQPFYTNLHQAILNALTENSASFLKGASKNSLT